MRWCLVVFAVAVGLLPGWCDAAPVARTATTQATSQEQIIAAVEKRYNAKVVRVTETTVAGRPALRLRLLSAQRVWDVLVDATTGQELAGG
jgi:uncharacterized membrane protein YkoI